MNDKVFSGRSCWLFLWDINNGQLSCAIKSSFWFDDKKKCFNRENKFQREITLVEF